jgi:hypothetical protein
MFSLRLNLQCVRLVRLNLSLCLNLQCVPGILNGHNPLYVCLNYFSTQAFTPISLAVTRTPDSFDTIKENEQ